MVLVAGECSSVPCDDSSVLLSSNELSSCSDLVGEIKAGDGASMCLISDSVVDKDENCWFKVGTGIVNGGFVFLVCGFVVEQLWIL
jgi:hypothetical protein